MSYISKTRFVFSSPPTPAIPVFPVVVPNEMLFTTYRYRYRLRIAIVSMWFIVCYRYRIERGTHFHSNV